MNSRIVSGAHRAEIQNIATQAAEWLRLVQSPEFKANDELLNWLKQSPLHVREFLVAWGVDQGLEQLDAERRVDLQALIAKASTNVLPIGAHQVAPPHNAEQPRPSRWLSRIAASVAAIGLLSGTWMWLARDSDGTYATAVGEQRNFELHDGSVIFLNTKSRVTVRFSEHSRDIDLLEGQALFDVESDTARPFRVHVGRAVIQAVGTQFDVRRSEKRITVAVVEGTVRLSAGEIHEQQESLPNSAATAQSELKAGEAATIDDGHISASVRVNPDVTTAWRRQQLVFEQAPLAQIVDEFNRYNLRPKLRIEGDEAALLRYNGVFGARNPESLLSYLAKRNDLVFDRRGDEIVIRQRIAAPDSGLAAQPQ